MYKQWHFHPPPHTQSPPKCNSIQRIALRQRIPPSPGIKRTRSQVSGEKAEKGDRTIELHKCWNVQKKIKPAGSIPARMIFCAILSTVSSSRWRALSVGENFELESRLFISGFLAR